MTTDNNNLKFLQLLSEKFPNQPSVATEIMNLNAILSLPKGTEHFLADIHGEYEAFIHVLKNASGGIRQKVNDLFSKTLTENEIDQLCTLIYYPQESINLLKVSYAQRFKENYTEELNKWYLATLDKIIKVCRKSGEKYTRSKVRKSLPPQYSYIILELMHEKSSDANKGKYIRSIFDSILEQGQAEDFIVAISNTIQRLVVDHLHIVGDIYDRGPGPEVIVEKLINYHKVDIQWGNHDLLWMGAACGNKACCANVVRISLRYANLDTLENAYGINLLPLASFASEVYKEDPCLQFKPKMGSGGSETYDEKNAYLIAQMQKAISIIQFKVESQIIAKHPEYMMDDRNLLHLCSGNTLNDKNFPTVNPESPYTLTPEEQTVIDQLAESFIRSERLQRHIEFFYKVGSMYLVCNKNLLCHASVPLTKDGDFKEVIVPQILADGTVGVEKFYGKSLYDKIDEIVRVAHIKPHSLESSAKVELIRSAVDYMWYLWCGPDSPLFDKSAMKTFERYFMDDKESHHEEKGYYFKLRTSEEICDKILKEFSLEGPDAHIINGHVPVKAKEGEFPLKAGGKLMVIDGGFSRAYQKSTGIAGYTLIYNSQGLHIVKHNPFTSTLSAIENKDDIESVTVVREPLSHRILVRETDNGKLLQSQVEDLKELLKAYRLGIIKEK